MVDIVQMTNYGIWVVLVLATFMGGWVLVRNCLVHILRADDPKRGAFRAMRASLPAAVLALLMASVPALMIWTYDPGLAGQAQGYAMFHVMAGAVVVFVVFLVVAAIDGGIREGLKSFSDAS